jgi:diacylglycerol kinase family enzyme
MYDPGILLLPIGSGNDFARALGTQGKPLEQLFDRFIRHTGKIIKSDCGQILFRHANESCFAERRFIGSCGIGLDAYISYLSNRETFLKGLPLYLSSALQAIFAFKPMQLSVIIEGKEATNGRIHLATIGNTPSSGGGFHLTPDAQIQDGLHNLTLGKAMSIIELLTLLPKAIKGTHIYDHKVTTFKFTECHIKIGSPEYIHTDGEVLGNDIVEVKHQVIPSKFTFFA